ncbi:hypothetical protein CF327_g4155 [Tilletia walkeri]|nr:hypothetical protein CF327_g4155 [Tilletia walkeri]
MKYLTCITIVLSAAASSMALFTHESKNACHLFEHAGLINLDVLGCSDVLSRDIRHHVGVDRERTCAALLSAGLSNLDVIGCHIRDEPTVPNLPRGCDGEHCAHEHPPHHDLPVHPHPPVQPPTKPTPPEEPCDEPGQPTPPEHPPTKPTPPEKPPTKPTPPEEPCDKPGQPPSSPSPRCSTKELCKVMQDGLINIDILGCSHILHGGDHWHSRMIAPPTSPAPKPKPCKECESPYGDEHEADCKSQACEILQHAGLINVDILGCARIG